MVTLSFLEKKLTKYINENKLQKSNKYPLLDNAFSSEDILSGIKILLSKKITMGEVTKEFETKFAKYLGVKYALMVNSGSSANLLSSFALINPKMPNHLVRNDKCIIQSLCWSTSLWPIVQSTLIPKFVDIDLKSINIDYNLFKKKITESNIKAAMIVHVLGYSSEIDKISEICRKKKIFLIEDTCESLGSKYKGKYLGTFGDFGTYSFYYSHQITSGEGGMIVCNDKKKYEIIHSLRSHGWDRGLNSKIKDNSFNFVNSGFNVRPTDVAAAIGLSQLKRLEKFIKIRNENREKIILHLKKSKNWKDQFTFLNPIKKLSPSYFGLPILINSKLKSKKLKFLKFLNASGIETRPILSGNFMNQKSIKLFNLNKENLIFNNAQIIEDLGFFIGIHTKRITLNELDYLTNKLLKIDKINF